MEQPQPQQEQAASAAKQPAKAPPRLMLSKPKPAVKQDPEPSEVGEVAQAPAAAAAEPKADEHTEALDMTGTHAEPKGGESDTGPAAQKPAAEAQSTSLKRQVRPPARLQASPGDGGRPVEAPVLLPPRLDLNAGPTPRGTRDKAELEVDWVIDKRTGKGGVEYRVRWVGSSDAEATWEPVANLANAMGKVDDYELRDKRRRGAAQGAQLRSPTSRRVGPPKRLVPEGGDDSSSAETSVARSFNPNAPAPTVTTKATKAKKSEGGNKKRKQTEDNDATAEDEDDPFAAFSKERSSGKPSGKLQRTAKGGAARRSNKTKRGQNNRKQQNDSGAVDKDAEGYLSEDEVLTEAEEDIEDALIELLEEVIRQWGDEPIDGYVCWARADGFPWWPAQLITLVGMDPKTMKQIVALYKEEYAKTHLLCMFLGDKPDFAWVPKERLRHFVYGREASMPSKKHAKYRQVMKALAIAEKIDNDPRDMAPELLEVYKADAKKMLRELDAVILQQRIFIRDSTRRIERVLDPSLLEKDAEAAKNLPIWAR